MSMHLRGSRDVMGKDESWWQSRTGLEQKLVILSTVLFILSFSLTISVIVLKNRSPAAPPAVTTVSPTNSTDTTVSPEETTTVPPEESTTVTPEETTTVTPEETTTVTPEETTTVTPEESTTLNTASSTDSTVTGSNTSPSDESSASDTSVSTSQTEPSKAEQDDLFAPGPIFINHRAARYISPRALANLNGA